MSGLDSLDGRLTGVEEDILSPIFDIVLRSYVHQAIAGGVFILNPLLSC
jgi:hypothetical protein